MARVSLGEILYGELQGLLGGIGEIGTAGGYLCLIVPLGGERKIWIYHPEIADGGRWYVEWGQLEDPAGSSFTAEAGVAVVAKGVKEMLARG